MFFKPIHIIALEPVGHGFGVFGDGDSIPEQNPIHRYCKMEDHSVTLAVIDNGGASNSISKNLTVTKEIIIKNIKRTFLWGQRWPHFLFYSPIMYILFRSDA